MTFYSRRSDSMHETLAFCLFKYFPYGGLQRDMLQIALACQERGYVIDIYTTSWEGDLPESFRLHTFRPTALTNHGRMGQYHTWVAEEMARTPADCVIGFNKMPGLDVYYAADGCFQARAARRHGRLYRLNPRYRWYVAFEEAVFGPDAKTHILMLTENQEALYVQTYGTPGHRIHRLPPNMSPNRLAETDDPQSRRTFRSSLGLGEDDHLLLQVASSFYTKGLDRSIRALAALPQALLERTWLAAVGGDTSRRYLRLARRLGVADRVTFLGPRHDIPRILHSADLLIHPARDEAAGIVLLEALTCGLPMIASSICGHAHYIDKAQAGWVLPDPFEQQRLNHTLLAALKRDDLRDVGRRGAEFARRENLCGMVETAVEVIEAVTHDRIKGRGSA